MTDYKALRALCEAATPGPWSVDHYEETDDWCLRADNATIPGNSIADAGGFSYKPDAAFIAAARTAIPELLDEVERLRAALERIVKNCDAEDAAKYKNVMFYDLLRLIAKAALADKGAT